MKDKIAIFLVFILLLSLGGCSKSPNQNTTKQVGIFLSSVTTERWIIDGTEMKKILEENGFTVELYFAEKNPEIQKMQILEMIKTGVDVMVITAVDAQDLASTLDIASADGIKIIAYDRLLINTDAVSYFASFDNYLVGVMQGNSLIEGMRAQSNGPYNIEIFAGSPDDSNSRYFYDGAMSVMQPLIDSGEIIIPSGAVLFDDVVTDNWSSEVADKRFRNILDSFYSSDQKLNGILSPNDTLAARFILTLKEFGYVPTVYFPIITGQDAALSNVKSIINSEQYSTIFKDTRVLAQLASSMVIAVLNDEDPEINDAHSFNNGVKVVPAYLCEPVVVTKENYREILIDSGYIKSEDLITE